MKDLKDTCRIAVIQAAPAMFDALACATSVWLSTLIMTAFCSLLIPVIRLL